MLSFLLPFKMKCFKKAQFYPASKWSDPGQIKTDKKHKSPIRILLSIKNDRNKKEILISLSVSEPQH
jgi:hypothetical protein